jgi:hypothetical protein
MGFLRFRKQIRLAPGLRLNLSKSGASLSVGGAGHTVNVSPRGLRTTVGVPGTGLSYVSSAPFEAGRESSPPNDSLDSLAAESVFADPMPAVEGGIDSDAESMDPVLLREADVLVTKRRFVVGVVNQQTTYAVRSMTSVTVRAERIHLATGNTWLGVGTFLIVFALWGAFLHGRLTAAGWLVVLGGLMVWGGWTQRKKWRQLVRFLILVRTSSGEQQVYASPDEQRVRRIAYALSQAIASP